MNDNDLIKIQEEWIFGEVGKLWEHIHSRECKLASVEYDIDPDNKNNKNYINITFNFEPK